MQTYNIQFDQQNDEATLLDENGEEVDFETAKHLLLKLNKLYDDKRETTIYLLYSSKMDLFKIGITSNLVATRIGQLQRQYDDPTIKIIHTISCTNREEAETKEKLLHQVFTHLNQNSYSDYGANRNLGCEWFCLSERDIVFIKSDNLFFPFRDTFVFHPMAFMQYAVEEKNCSRQIYQMLVLLTEILK